MCPQMSEETRCYHDVSPAYEWGMKIRNQMWFGSHLGCHFHIQADKITECWWGCGIIVPPLPGWWGYNLLQTFQRTVWLDPSRFWMDMFIDPALLFLELFPKDVISRGHQEMDTKSFFGDIVYKKKNLKQPQCASWGVCEMNCGTSTQCSSLQVIIEWERCRWYYAKSSNNEYFISNWKKKKNQRQKQSGKHRVYQFPGKSGRTNEPWFRNPVESHEAAEMNIPNLSASTWKSD